MNLRRFLTHQKQMKEDSICLREHEKEMIIYFYYCIVNRSLFIPYVANH
jgi:hypothetical protein